MSNIPEASPMPARTGWSFNLIWAALAFVVWGGWAYYVSLMLTETGGRPIVSGLTQGCGSFMITLIMVQSVTWLYHRLPHNAARLFLPALITVAATGSCLAIAHSIVATPNIAQTIAPGLGVALGFSTLVTVKLRRAEQPTESETENSDAERG